MRFLITGNSETYRNQRLVEEGKKKGVQVDLISSRNLQIKASNEGFEYSINGTHLEEYDLIYCLGPHRSVRQSWYAALKTLSGKVHVANGFVQDTTIPATASMSWYYHKQYEKNIPFPKTYILYSLESFEYIKQDIKYPIIGRLDDSSKGSGVFLLHSEEEVKEMLRKNIQETKQMIGLREFIPNQGDLRVFTVGYKVIGAMKRTAAKGDFRNNISQGGTGELFDIEKRPDIKQIAEQLSEISKIEVAGVDVIIHKETQEPFVLEINKSPDIVGFEKYTKMNVAGAIIDYLIEKVHANTQ